MPYIQLDLRARRMLLADWFVRLARESGLDFRQRSSGQDSFRIGDPNAFHVTAHFNHAPPFLVFLANDTRRQGLIDDIAEKAAEFIERRDFGGVAWYSSELHEIGPRFSPFSLIGPLLQQLGSQTRIAGWRRLGPDILLEFVEELRNTGTDEPTPFAPKAAVHLHIAAPGPCAGDFSSHIAHGVIETVGAICGFALGRLVELPHSIFPTKDKMLSGLDTRRSDPQIQTLARKGQSLDIFSLVAVDGGFEVFQRSRAALLTFDAAARQERDSVAAILYVVAAECLTTPYANWRLQKLTKRFITFFSELMPSDLDQIIAHANFEEAFGIRKGTRTARALRRELLDVIYAYRSGQLHMGLNPSYAGLAGLDTSSATRRGLLGDFAEAAVLRYLQAPRVSLVGHPALD